MQLCTLAVLLDAKWMNWYKMSSLPKDKKNIPDNLQFHLKSSAKILLTTTVVI